MPSFSIVPVKPKPLMITPMAPSRGGDARCFLVAAAAQPAHEGGQHEERERDPEQLEEDAPLAGAALFLDRLQGDLLEHRALPLRGLRIDHGVWSWGSSPGVV